MRRTLYLLAAFLAPTLGAGSSAASAQSKVVILSTTTSTQDSGLLDVLVPMFEKKTGLTVKTLSVGTGRGQHARDAQHQQDGPSPHHILPGVGTSDHASWSVTLCSSGHKAWGTPASALHGPIHRSFGPLQVRSRYCSNLHSLCRMIHIA